MTEKNKNKYRVLGKKVEVKFNPNNYNLDKFENPHFKTTYNIRISVPEFTSICPVTDQPDFAYITIDYIPNRWIVESKSFKMYINSYRNFGIFHEDVTIKIGKFLHKELVPRWIRIASFFSPRGGIPIDVFWQSKAPPKDALIPTLEEKNLKLYNR